MEELLIADMLNNFSGSIIFPLTGIMFVFIFWQSRKKSERVPEFSLKYGRLLGIIVIIIFLIGLINELVRMFS